MLTALLGGRSSDGVPAVHPRQGGRQSAVHRGGHQALLERGLLIRDGGDLRLVTTPQRSSGPPPSTDIIQARVDRSTSR